MSTVAEIEEAIRTLPPEELEKLADWWKQFHDSRDASTDRENAIVATSGCLAGGESDDFPAAVAEAGQGIDEDHGW